MKRFPFDRMFDCMLYGTVILLCLFSIPNTSDAAYERSASLNCRDADRIDGRCWHSYTFRFSGSHKTPLFAIFSKDFKPVLLIVSPGISIAEFKLVDESDSGAVVKILNFTDGELELLITSFDPRDSGEYTLIKEYASDFRRTALSAYSRDSGPSFQILIDDLYKKGRTGGPAKQPAPAVRLPSPAIGLGGGEGGPQDASTSRDTDPSKPAFPWPPPRASAFTTLDNEMLLYHTPHPCHFKDVNDRIVRALRRRGYHAYTYYEIPNGFALVTRIEQINTDGTSKGPPARWEIELPPHDDFSLDNLIKAIFSARIGYFRVIVFIITSDAFSQSDAEVHREEAIEWFYGGLNTLPDAVRLKPYTPQHYTTALIYEFEKVRDAMEANQVKPGRFQGYDHLKLSGIYPALEDN